MNDFEYTAGKGLKWVEDDNAVNPESMFAIKFNKLASWNTTSLSPMVTRFISVFAEIKT